MSKFLIILSLFVAVQSYGQRTRNNECKCHLANIPDSLGTRKQLFDDPKLVCDNKACELARYRVAVLFLTGKKDYYGPYTSTKAELPSMALQFINQNDGPFRIFIEDVEVKNAGVLTKQPGSLFIKIKD